MPSPATQPHLHPAFDDAAFTATDVHNPAIALIDRRRHLGLLLARDMTIEPDGVLLHAVRWIRFPLRWRLTATRLLSRVAPVHLPDEWLVNEVFLGLASNGMFVARPHSRSPIVLPCPGDSPYPCKPLTAAHYHRLLSAPGRLLLAQLTALFPEHLGLDGQRAPLASPPEYPQGHAPWTLFAG